MKIQWSKKYNVRAIYALIVIFISVLFTAMVVNFSEVSKFFQGTISLLMPFIWGFVVAYLLNPIMMFFDKKLLGKLRLFQKYKGLCRGLSIFIAYLIALGTVGIFVYICVPQIAESITGIAKKVPDVIAELTLWTNRFLGSSSVIYDFFNANSQKISDSLQTTVMGLLENLTDFAVKFTKTLKDIALGAMIAVYLLASKEKFFAQTKKIFYALFKKKYVDQMIRLSDESHETFSGFIVGKIIDSAIIGILCYLFMLLVGWPYPMLISVIVGVTNIIPFFGPLIGAIPSTLILLMESPMTALFFVIFILVLQQVDGNFIGPKILSQSMGLTAFWIIFAILIMGGLFGFVGMVIGVPLFTVIYSLIRTFIVRRLESKGLSKDTKDYMEKGPIDAVSQDKSAEVVFLEAPPQ